MTFDEWFSKTTHTEWEQLNALKGIPQPEQWHPEGDAYVHTLMVCREVWDRYYYGDAMTNVTMCAAIAHDFGKALTNPEKWPSHYGHADLGVTPTKAFLREYWNYPGVERTVNICAFTTKYHMHMHQIHVMKPSTFVKIFLAAVEMCGERYMLALETLAKLGVCDHYGRGNVDHSVPYYDTLRFLAYMYQVDVVHRTWKGYPRELESRLRNLKNWNFYRDYDLNGAKPNRYPVYLERANGILRLRKD